jgi:HSP20 family molecular chaperone IbpA
MTKDDIEVTLRDDTFTLSGEKKKEEKELGLIGLLS